VPNEARLNAAVEQKLKRTGGRALALAGTILFWSLACETLAPEAERVKVTGKANDVAGCKVLGTVESSPPYVGPNDGVNQLRNKTAGLGGNVLFLTSTGAMRGKNGMAYLCGVGGSGIAAPSAPPTPEHP
jgi:hypothetical protein